MSDPTEDKEQAENSEAAPLEASSVVYNENNIHRVIDVLRDRVKNLRTAAIITMVFMAIAMVAGFGVFYDAGSIVAKENIDTYQRASSIRSTLIATQTEVKSLASQINDLDKEKSQEVSDKLGTLEKKIESIVPTADKIVEAMPEEQEQKKELNNRISIFSMITRVTVGILLIFLIQILVKMYRYNVRLAAFYEARADALQLASNLNSVAVERAAKLLSPEAIDFGEMPEPPSKQVIELVKQVGGLLKKEK